ncbi:MAG: chromosomal replication initiator protein DnaA [Oscillospiraceae bacterium]|nr:chromosomal replication initiator protein DnaA [Oscillospiraceae bacterium]
MNSNEEVWAKVLEILESELTPTAIKTWFGSCRVMELKDNLLVLYTPSEFSRDVISSRYETGITAALKEIFGNEFRLQVICESELDRYEAGKEAGAGSSFDGDQFTFDKFIVGNSNRFAYAAAVAVAENPAKVYNPLFIYGESGLGKTHLLYSIGHEIKKSFPKFRIVYIKGDDFTNELINAIQTGKNNEFREKYRRADLLLVDDIQFISGKVQTQEEFFHTFNSLYESGRQIVLTSDRPPKDMPRLEERLQSRFVWGMLADIQPPDYETRVAIAKNKASRIGLMLSDEACRCIADNIKENVRQIEGIIKKLQAYRELEPNGGSELSLVEKSIKEVIRSDRTFTPDYIVEKIASYYGLTPEELSGKSKVKNTAQARQIAMYLMRKLTNMTLEEIGAVLNKDHSTVLHSIKKVEEGIADSLLFADAIRDITANITNK